MNLRNKCCVVNCSSQAGTSPPEVRYFAVPRTDNVGLKWLEFAKNPKLNHEMPSSIRCNYRMCSLHFADESFTNHLKLKLNRRALPTLNAPPTLPSTTVSSTISSTGSSSSPNFKHNSSPLPSTISLHENRLAAYITPSMTREMIQELEWLSEEFSTEEELLALPSFNYKTMAPKVLQAQPLLTDGHFQRLLIGLQAKRPELWGTQLQDVDMVLQWATDWDVLSVSSKLYLCNRAIKLYKATECSWQKAMLNGYTIRVRDSSKILRTYSRGQVLKKTPPKPY